MTIYCVACKKEAIPGDKSRSFHKFPDDAINQNIWRAAIGTKCSVTKNTKICSDHFDKSAFVETNAYTKKRQLLPTAVPHGIVNVNEVLCDTTKHTSNLIINDQMQPLSCKILNSSGTVDIESSSNQLNKDCVINLRVKHPSKLFGNPNSQQTIFKDSRVIEKFSNLTRTQTLEISDYSQKQTLPSLNELNVGKIICRKREKSHIDLNLKRHYAPPIDVSHIPHTKKIRFFDGYQPMQLSREDLVSDEAWKRCLKYHFSVKRQMQTLRKKDSRKSMKIANFKELVSKFKEEK